MSTEHHSAVVPILRSFDEALARSFYLDFLGFEVLFEHRFGPDAPLYMGIRKGNCVLHLSEHFGDSTPGQRVRIETVGLKAMAQRLRAANYKFAKPGEPQEQPWRELDLTIADPFGNKLTFCEEL
ncbi:MAG: glyoxalase superfamily protein [Pseudomonadota bacterium]